MTDFAFLLAAAVSNPRADALIWRGQQTSFAALRERRETARQQLAAAGIGAGEVVVLEADFSPAAVATLLALLEMRAIVAPLTNPADAGRERVFRDSDAAFLARVADDSLEVTRLPGRSDHELFAQLRAAGHAGLVLFTSGSTGASKGVVHDATRLLRKYARPRHCLRTLAFMPFDAIGGLDTLFYSLASGSCLVVPDERSPDAVCAAIAEYEVEVLPASPSFLNLVLVSEAWRRFDCSRLKFVTYGAEVMPEHVLKRCAEIFPRATLLQKYGTTELGVLRSRSRASDSPWVRLGGEGVETRVVDGVLQVRSEGSMLGYLEGAGPVTPDGWLVTGDAVEQDGAYVRILGRQSDLINVGGRKVFPAEVEAVLLRAANVAEAAVRGEPHALLGAIVVATVRLREPEEARAAARRLKGFCAAQLEPFKVPVKLALSEKALSNERQKTNRARRLKAGRAGISGGAGGRARSLRLRSMTMNEAADLRRNRLAEEASPYLLQHANNPVDWQPWGEEAFARARAENKPVFLSIGYSTCHWCHVMAHESFEDAAIAALLNEHFVSIKVDREERPDVDRVYMTYVQAMTGGGGWPMSVWLTPDRQPFYGGTYFPPTDRWGRPGFAAVLRALARLWREDRGKVLEQAAHAADALRQAAAHPAGGDEAIGRSAIERGLEELRNSFDPAWGGFGDAPKFPRPATMDFLWRVFVAAGEEGDLRRAADARDMALATLRRMVAGGIHDHLGGGFHRYAVDATWHVPHFEKMLYDQAQLVSTLLAGWQLTADESLAAAARDTLGYLRRDLAAPEGGFFSAEDADSPREAGGERSEGAFYVWTATELHEVLGNERAEMFAAHFGVEEKGNAPEGADPHGEFAGRNILIRRLTLEETATAAGVAPAEAASLLEECRAALFAARAKRPRPHRDEKIVTAWNGLAISAFARAARVFDERELAAFGARTATFIERALWDEDAGVLRRSFCAGRVGPEGFAEDYACLVQGLLDLYETTFEIHWLRWADALQKAQDRLFWDGDNGGYFASSGRDDSVLVRMKEDHDGAEPAASSVAAMNLLRLGRMLGDEARVERARRTMLAFADTWARSPQAMPAMLAALSDSLRPPRQIVLAGRPGAPDFDALAREVHSHFLPGTVLLAADGGEGQAWLAGRAPWLREMRPVEGRAAAYVCANFVCRMPVTDPAALRAALMEARRQ